MAADPSRLRTVCRAAAAVRANGAAGKARWLGHGLDASLVGGGASCFFVGWGIGRRSRFLLAAEGDGGDADRLFEYGAEVFGVIEADVGGDFREGQFGAGEEFFDAANADALDFVVWGALEMLLEASFQLAAGDTGGPDDITDADGVAGILSDEAHGPGDYVVVDGDDVGGLANNDLDRIDERFGGRLAAALHEVVEQAGGHAADAFGVELDAAQRRFGEFAVDGVVVDSQHGDLFWHGQAGLAAGVEDLLSADVVAGEEADGFGQFLEPPGQRVGREHGQLLAGREH